MVAVSERLAKLRERTKPSNEIVEPKPSAGPTGFDIIRWFDKIRSNPSIELITEAGVYYDAAVKDGAYYVVPVGNLQTLQEQLPGITFFYQGILVDVQQSRRWVEERLERMEAQKHNYYMYGEEAKAKYGVLKTTESSKLAKADPEVTALSDAVRLLAFHEHNVERLIAALADLKYVLNNIVTIRENKLEEVWVDATKETKNA
jgi:hypothetical protein